MLCSPIRTTLKPVAAKARTTSVVARRTVAVKAQETGIDVEKAIKEAQETCADDDKAAECATAWDEVEELSAAANDKSKAAEAKDPLEEFCKEVPEADECRVYED